MDAIVLLKQDHKTVNTLFREFEKTKDSASATKKRELVDQILKELTTHAFIEETVFYPVARAAVPETEDHVLESIEGIDAVPGRSLNSSAGARTTRRSTPRSPCSIENVRHHVEEEEQGGFPGPQGPGRKRLLELGERLEAAKPQAPSDPMRLSSARA